ncbi:MAG: hypothetical protein JNM89_01675 [Hyphomicrobiaceae bacterium]|nr:hypothetical protein [Hyphomicrobiaceae bacterium]
MSLVALRKDAATPAEQLWNALGTVRLLLREGTRSWGTELRIERGQFYKCRTSAEAIDLINMTFRRRIDELDAVGAEWCLAIPPVGPQGFAIDVAHNSGELRVLFGELEETFVDYDQALTWVARALSDSYHLRILVNRGCRYEWYLEPVDGAGPRLATGQLNFAAFYSKPSEIRFSNALTA